MIVIFAKTAEPIEMLFEVPSQVIPRKHVLDRRWQSRSPCRWAILKHRDSAVSGVKTVEPIEMPFGKWTLVGP